MSTTTALVPHSLLSPSSQALLQNDGYTFRSLLGEGSYGKVYYGVMSKRGRELPFACKVINSSTVPKEVANKFLPREIEVLTKVSHPHIIHVLELCHRKSCFLIFMRFAEVGDLLDHILEHGEVDEGQARLWFYQIAVALHYLHSLDIAHRDIKCENILITANMNAKLADFGFSRFVVGPTGKQVTSSTYCGSYAYAAPEILKGRPYLPKGGDVWALGVVLYVMLNSGMPFPTNSPAQLYNQQMANRWKFRSRVAGKLSQAAQQTVAAVLEPVAVKRPKAEDLRTFAWVLADSRLQELSAAEKAALETALRLKKDLVPKSRPKLPPNRRSLQKIETARDTPSFPSHRMGTPTQSSGRPSSSSKHDAQMFYQDNGKPGRNNGGQTQKRNFEKLSDLRL